MSYSPAPGRLYISVHLLISHTYTQPMKSKSSPPAPGSKGTAALKDLIKFIIIGIQKATRLDDNGDGRISLLEGLSLITTLGFKIPGVYNAFPEVVAEWKDLSQEERDEMVAWFAKEFDLPGLEHGKIEALIKESVDIISDNYTHVQRIRAILG